jgi:hypothetical protein
MACRRIARDPGKRFSRISRTGLRRVCGRIVAVWNFCGSGARILLQRRPATWQVAQPGMVFPSESTTSWGIMRMIPAMFLGPGIGQDDPSVDAIAPARGLLCAMALSCGFWMMLALAFRAV